jgi:DNA binding domain, excisionase family
MNLKQCSLRLGVHYQTAYKWVRTGQLTAVRVGSRYEISEAAIVQFAATRRSLLSEVEPAPAGHRVSDMTQDDVLAGLEAMTTDPILTAASVATLAARRGAEVLGDICLVVLMGDDGRSVAHTAIDHSEPDRASFVRTLFDKSDDWPTTKSGGMAVGAYVTGRPVLIPHVPQERLRAAMPPELHQFLAQSPIHSLVSAPVSAAGTTTGFVAFTRDTANRPYTAADEDFASRLGTRIGSLFQAACEIELAWQIRSELTDALQAKIAPPDTRRPPTIAELGQIFADHPNALALPVAILDAKCRFVTANDAFLSSTGYPQAAIADRSIESIIHPDTRAVERAGFERLVSGEFDYLDVPGLRVLPDGREMSYVCHRAAVRHLDATLKYIVTVARPLQTPTPLAAA